MANQINSFDGNQAELNSKEKMVRGSIWMAVGNVFSRVLGAVYIIPWYAMMGENAKIANSLFNKGYNLYALFLMIATAGIPGAIAKQIAYYNSQNEYQISQRLFRRTLIIMTGFGIVCAVGMYLFSPILAAGDPDLIPVMRALSIAVLIFPGMSVIRGYFQGNQDMMPSAISQIIEQIFRVFYLLLATFIIIKVSKGDYVSAVVQSTFAAFIGMIGAYITLIYFYKKQQPKIARLIDGSSNELSVSENNLVKEMLKEAIPFIIVGSAITLFKLVDQYTFEPIMESFTDLSKNQLSALFSIFSANPDKLVMITISLATGMAMTSLSLITEAFTKKDEVGLAKLVGENIQLLFFIMIPATFGMVTLANPIYTLFYEPDALGVSVLIQASYVGLIMGYFILISTTLLGLYKNSEAVFYFSIGLGIKLVLQYPLVRSFEVYGPLLATAVGFIVSSYLMTRKVQQITKFDYSLTVHRTLLIFIFSLVMSVGTILTKSFLCLFLNPERKFQALVIILFSVSVGISIYAWLVLKTRLADKIMGGKVEKIRVKLKIK